MATHAVATNEAKKQSIDELVGLVYDKKFMQLITATVQDGSPTTKLAVETSQEIADLVTLHLRTRLGYFES